MKNIIIFLTFMTSLIACKPLVQEISPDNIPNSEAKLVVSCFLSPNDKIIRARVLTTIPMFGQEDLQATNGIGKMVINGKDTTYLPSQDDIIDALVEISEGSQNAKLSYNAAEGVYAISATAFPIVAGKTYGLKVTAKDGRVVTANCTVPKAIRIDSYQKDSIAVNYQVSNNGKTELKSGFDLFVNVKWNDEPNQKNYYEMIGYSKLSQTFKTKDSTLFEFIYFNDQRGRGAYFDDKLTENQQIIAKKGVYRSVNWGRSNGQNSGTAVLKQATLLLSQIDENYYFYRRAIYDFRQQNFFTEPTLLYTNIKGGYGVFAAYNTTEVEIFK